MGPRPITSAESSADSQSPSTPTRIDTRSSFVAVLTNIGPDELVASASVELHEFLNLYEDTLLLLVRIREADKELAAGLAVTAMRDEANLALDPVTPSTEVLTGDIATAAYSKGRAVETEAGLMRVLASSRRFAVPLRKRITAEANYPDRVSVGRAPNKDIVLRHESVSKSHCWFEVDETGTFFLTDAGSTNSTRLNGIPITAPSTPVQAGDALSFGAVEATLCSPMVLWRVLGTAVRRVK